MPSKRVSLKGKGADLFFGDYAPGTTEPTRAEVAEVGSSTDTEATPIVIPNPPSTPLPLRSPEPRSSDNPSRPTTRPSGTPQTSATSKRASTLASTLAQESDTVDAIRKIVKVPGKEVSFTRLTPEEKAQITDIVYAYKRQGQKTTENEINRIALNYLLHDYNEHGKESVLARVLAALLA